MDTHFNTSCFLGVLRHKALKMKKIILSLMLLTSFVFSASSPFVNGQYLRIYASCYSFVEGGTTINYINGTRSELWFLSDNQGYRYFHTSASFPSDKDGYTHAFNETVYYGSQVKNSFCVPCASPNILDANGNCVTPPPPQCGEGTYLNPATLSCAPMYPIADEETLESGSKNIIFEDGAMMIVNPDGTAVTFAPDGAKIPNRLYNGSIPEVGYLSESKNIGVNGSDFFTVNPLGIFLKSTALALVQNTALLWTYAMSDQKETANGDVAQFTPTQNGVAVNISEKAFDNIDFSEYENKATTTPQSVPNSDLAYKKLSDAEILQFLGATKEDTVFYKPNDPSYFVASNADSVAVVKSNPDGSAQKVEFQKNDLQNTANNNTDLTAVKKEIAPQKITADGKIQQTQTSTPMSVSPLDNFPKTTNPSTGLPDYVDYDPRTGLKDGKVYSTATGQAVTDTNGNPIGTGTGAAPDGVSPKAPITPNPDGNGTNINLSGVTSRLDKISNQLTVLNNRNEKLDKIGDNAYAHGIPTGGTSPYDWTSHQATFENLKSTIDDLNGQADEIKALFQNGFTLNLSGSAVDTCPYNSTIDLDGRAIAVSFDLCKTFSPMRPLLYAFFYLFFVFNITYFGVKSILRFA